MFNIKQIRICLWDDGSRDIDIYVIKNTYVRYHGGNITNYRQIALRESEKNQTTDYAYHKDCQRREIFLSDLKNIKIVKLLRHFISLHLNTVRY